MKPIIKLDLKSKQRLFLSFALKKALKILSLPLLDLKTLIEEDLISNPLLEKNDITPYIPIYKPISNTENNLNTFIYQKSLFEHLKNQAKEIFTGKELKTAIFLIGSLNNKGFLDENIKELSLGFYLNFSLIQLFINRKFKYFFFNF